MSTGSKLLGEPRSSARKSGAQISLLSRRLRLLADQYRSRTGVDVAQLVPGAPGVIDGTTLGYPAYDTQAKPFIVKS